MNPVEQIFNLKPFIITYISVISFSTFVFVLFSQTIPDLFANFFRDAGVAIILGAVFVFAIAWFLKARPHNKPKTYKIICFDVFGNETKITGIRIDFKNHDVAWSFMKQYKEMYPLNNFALTGDQTKSDKQIIFRYL